MSGEARPAGSGGAAGSDRDRSWTVLELLRWTTDYFKRAGIESAVMAAGYAFVEIDPRGYRPGGQPDPGAGERR